MKAWKEARHECWKFQVKREDPLSTYWPLITTEMSVLWYLITIISNYIHIKNIHKALSDFNYPYSKSQVPTGQQSKGLFCSNIALHLPARQTSNAKWEQWDFPYLLEETIWRLNKGLRQIIPLANILLGSYCWNAWCFQVTWAVSHVSPVSGLASRVHSHSCNRPGKRHESKRPVIFQTSCFWWWSCLQLKNLKANLGTFRHDIMSHYIAEGIPRR